MNIEKAKRIVRKAVNTPEYNPNQWKNALKAGCYPYAINLLKNEFFFIGSIIGKECKANVSDEELISVLKEELNTIGYIVKEIEVEDTIDKDEFKIYLQREEHTGFYHFLRQDADGYWSHKYPDELPIRTDSTGYMIEDPEAMVDMPFRGWCFKLKKAEG